MWDAHLPNHANTDTCKVAIYTQKTLAQTHTINLHTDHRLASLNSMILDITSTDGLVLRLINIYHPLL